MLDTQILFVSIANLRFWTARVFYDSPNGYVGFCCDKRARVLVLLISSRVIPPRCYKHFIYIIKDAMPLKLKFQFQFQIVSKLVVQKHDHGCQKTQKQAKHENTLV